MPARREEGARRRVAFCTEENGLSTKREKERGGGKGASRVTKAACMRDRGWEDREGAKRFSVNVSREESAGGFNADRFESWPLD